MHSIAVAPVDAGDTTWESLPRYARVHETRGFSLHALLEFFFAHVAFVFVLSTSAYGRDGTVFELPHATAKSLRVIGKIRSAPEDFRVDEVPAYAPAGHGTHVFVRFRKRGLTTKMAVERIAQTLGTSARDAGYAGLKDRHAITTQWASFTGTTPEAALALTLPDIDVLEAQFHPHKLRTGHLRGNRFELVIRGDAPDAEVAHTLMTTLERSGAPNYYGEQRFGTEDRNLVRAKAWVLGGERAPRDRFERKLLFSTLQSWLFNTWLAERLHDGLFEVPLPGDVLRKEDSGGLFVNQEQVDAEQRMASWQVSPTGPMFGASMRPAEAAAGEREQAILARAQISSDTFAAHAKYGEGTRRVSRVRPASWAIQSEPGALRVQFELPSGAYATMIMRELLKPGPEDA
jgi:tRNA pseudouridine13 synthase